jgi:hypothetical protein
MTVESAVLVVNVKIGSFGGVVTDKEVTEEVRESKHISRGSKPGRYAKNLLKNWFALGAYNSWARRTQEYVKKMTLPFDGGGRLLPAELYFDFVTEIGKLKTEGDRRKTTLAAEYDAEVAKEAMRLGAMYRPDDYPTKGEFISKFSWSCDFLPLPSASNFSKLVSNLGEDIAKELEKETEKGLQQSLGNAQKALCRKVQKIVAKLGEVASSDSPKIYQSLLDSVDEMITVLPKQNILKDPAVADMFKEIEQRFKGLSKKELKEDAAVRAKAKKDVADVLGKLGSLI